MVNIRPITNVIGILLLILGALMLSCLGYSVYFDSPDTKALLNAGLITMAFGFLLSLYRRGQTTISKREGYMIVALGWTAMVVFGALPYILTGAVDSVIDAIFESVSGFTTTGATIFDDIEQLPKGLLFWRSMTQWIGGMGIIVLTVAIFPLLGIGGIELFVAESPGPTSDKIHPRITVTARRLWLLYVGLTIVLIILMRVMGMSFYDAINHSFTTMSTGGFSTHNSSIAYFSPSLQYLIIIFMFIAGTNFTVIYFAVTGRLRRVWKSDEFRGYVILTVALCLGIALVLFFNNDINFEQAFRDTSFQVVSLVTTTGYITADYSLWGTGLIVVIFALMFVGACAGSTAGGIKLVRHIVFVKNSILEFKRILHPRAIVRIKINQEIVAPRILTHILVFLLLYLGIFFFGTTVVASLGMDIVSAAGATASSLGNVGPGLGTVGPVSTYSSVPAAAKVVLSFLMLLGRLELFTILVLFTPYFWKTT